MQTTEKAFGEEAVPDTPCAVGAIAILEAAFDLVEQDLVIPVCWLGEQLSQAWKPERDTLSASQRHATGQIERCFATNATFISRPWQSRRRPS